MATEKKTSTRKSAKTGQASSAHLLGGSSVTIVVAGDNSEARAPVLGVALAGGGGKAFAANVGVARAFSGEAHVADGGVAFCDIGIATCGNGVAYIGHNGQARAENARGTALVDSGIAEAAQSGIASVRMAGKAAAGPGGIAIAWNEQVVSQKAGKKKANEVDPLNANVAAGPGGVLIAFRINPNNGKRQPVVGFVGKAVDVRLQSNLDPDRTYKLDEEGKFVAT